MWSDRYFALLARIHGAECCGANPPKLEMIRSFAPLFWSDETKEFLLPNMTHEVLHHSKQYMLGHFLGDAKSIKDDVD